MDKQVVSWAPLVGLEGQSSFAVLSAKFGDGYEQTAADGIQNKRAEWPLSFTDNNVVIAEIAAFLDLHAGWKAFLWTPPLGVEGEFKASKYALKPLGGNMYTLSVTFRQTG